MLIGVSSHLDYADFAGKLAPAAAVALALTAGFILLFYREEFSTAFGLSAKEPRPRQHSRQLAMDARDLGSHRWFFCRRSNR